MTTYHFTLPWVVLDSATATLIRDRADGVLLDRYGQQVDARTPLGVPTLIRTGPAGTTVPFVADVPAGRVRFGTVEAAVWADENMDAAERAEAAAADARAVLERVTWIGENANEVSYFRRDLNGDVWVTDTPVIDGTGGYARIDSTGDVILTFP